MGQVIILEGPDGGGKTILAKRLEKEFGFKYKHEGPPPDNIDLIAYYLEILNESIEGSQNVVHDRLWLGERIYGPIVRGIDRLGHNGQTLFTRLCDSKEVTQIICLPFRQVAIDNYSIKMKDPNDFLKSMEKFQQVYESYLDWTYSNKCRIFNYEKNNVESLIQDIDKFPPNRSPKGLVGSKQAKYLFIGDRPNHPSIDVPFHALNGSSGYFNSALIKAGLKESEIAISNAFSPINHIHSLGAMLAWLNNIEHIFLMGQAAKAWYDERATHIYKTSYIPHPSYLKRFKGSNSQVLADIIKERIHGSTN
jgi:thymidylate kinase